MYCKHCGTALPQNARFCAACGQPSAQEAQASPAPAAFAAFAAPRIGYSERIRDRPLRGTLKNSNRWSASLP
jgi:predicted amidophosphoribosyltransferase